jgi:hypothetical protein
MCLNSSPSALLAPKQPQRVMAWFTLAVLAYPEAQARTQAGLESLDAVVGLTCANLRRLRPPPYIRATYLVRVRVIR